MISATEKINYLTKRLEADVGKRTKIAKLETSEASFDLFTGLNVIGNVSSSISSNSHFVVLTEPGVSSIHALIEISANGNDHFVEDLYSTNGTFYGLDQLHLTEGKMYQLLDGKQIKFGPTCCTYRILPQAPTSLPLTCDAGNDTVLLDDLQNNACLQMLQNNNNNRFTQESVDISMHQLDNENNRNNNQSIDSHQVVVPEITCEKIAEISGSETEDELYQTNENSKPNVGHTEQEKIAVSLPKKINKGVENDKKLQIPKRGKAVKMNRLESSDDEDDMEGQNGNDGEFVDVGAPNQPPKALKKTLTAAQKHKDKLSKVNTIVPMEENAMDLDSKSVEEEEVSEEVFKMRELPSKKASKSSKSTASKDEISNAVDSVSVAKKSTGKKAGTAKPDQNVEEPPVESKGKGKTGATTKASKKRDSVERMESDKESLIELTNVGSDPEANSKKRGLASVVESLDSATATSKKPAAKKRVSKKNAVSSSTTPLPTENEEPHLLQENSSSRPSSASKNQKQISEIRVLFTGISDEAELSMYRKFLKDLGGVEVAEFEACTVLVTDRMRRTAKFMCALTTGKCIVGVDWLTKSKKANAFCDPQENLLKDAENEKKFGFNLKKSLDRTKKQDVRLFEGIQFYCTPSVLPQGDEMDDILAAAGATYLQAPPTQFSKGIHICADPKDKAEISSLKNLGFKIYSKELILTGILRQEVKLQDHLLR